MTYRVFISYRRDDAGAEALLLSRELSNRFGQDEVFFDSTGVVPGDRWPEKIREALASAAIVVVVMGRNWIRAADEWGRRRIDDENDWVHQEVKTALVQNKRIVPVLIDGAARIPCSVMPEPINGLSDHQCFVLRRDYFDHDVELLMSQIEPESRARRSGIEAPAGPYPVSPYTPPDPIPAAKLKDVLDNEIPNWSRTESPLPEDPAKRRVELHRSFVFRDFQSAVNFMAQTAPACDITDHHPRWQNIWSTVDIYLSTWDGDLHQITDRDVMLARYFDKVFDEYDPVKTRTITA